MTATLLAHLESARRDPALFPASVRNACRELLGRLAAQRQYNFLIGGVESRHAGPYTVAEQYRDDPRPRNGRAKVLQASRTKCGEQLSQTAAGRNALPSQETLSYCRRWLTGAAVATLLTGCATTEQQKQERDSRVYGVTHDLLGVGT